jgi:SAM-dependent methyltransferase
MYGWKSISAVVIIENKMASAIEAELSRVYTSRFDARQEYRRRVWGVLVRNFFQPLVGADSVVLDLGCGYGEFINCVTARKKFGMDLNPNAQEHLAPDVTLLRQDCSSPWGVGADQLDVVFTSNFFEHLPNKEALGMTLEQAFRALRRGGRIIAMGPNIKFTQGRYWDFWDHYLPLTDLSLAEGMTVRGFEIRQSHARFLPYTMVGAREYPLWCINWYLRCPWLWRWKGEQFLVIAQKP